jgi:hypothetical protein
MVDIVQATSIKVSNTCASKYFIADFGSTSMLDSLY